MAFFLTRTLPLSIKSIGIMKAFLEELLSVWALLHYMPVKLTIACMHNETRKELKYMTRDCKTNCPLHEYVNTVKVSNHTTSGTQYYRGNRIMKMK